MLLLILCLVPFIVHQSVTVVSPLRALRISFFLVTAAVDVPIFTGFSMPLLLVRMGSIVIHYPLFRVTETHVWKPRLLVPTLRTRVAHLQLFTIFKFLPEACYVSSPWWLV